MADEIKNIVPDKAFPTVMYDVKEMAAILDCSPRTVMNYIKQGKLKTVKIAGKWKITKENLEAFCNGK